MEIRQLELIEGARKAEGLTVIIDVFRAFSVAAYAMAQGAREIFPAGSAEDAFALAAQYPAVILIGEQGGKKVNGYDYGNSPDEISHVQLKDKVIIQSTGAGTRGLANALHASEIIAGSFPTADAIVRYIKSKSPEVVSLVAMGTRGVQHSEEDTVFSEYIRNQLEGKRTLTQEKIICELQKVQSAKKFFDPEAYWAPEQDFYKCLTLNKFPFVLVLADGKALARKSLQKKMV